MVIKNNIKLVFLFKTDTHAFAILWQKFVVLKALLLETCYIISGLALGSTDSGVAILDLHSGAVSKGRRFVNIYALDNISQLFSLQDFAVYRWVNELVHTAQTVRYKDEVAIEGTGWHLGDGQISNA